MRVTGAEGQPSPLVSHMMGSPLSLGPQRLASAFQLSETYLMRGRVRKGLAAV
jgi:hypothetical protein